MGHAVKMAQPFAQLGPHTRVEGTEGFVQQQQLGMRRQGAGKSDALALPTRELSWIPVAESFQLNQAKQLVYAGLDVCLRGSAHAQPEGDVLAHAHVVEEREILKDESETTFARGNVDDVVVAYQHATMVGGLESRDDAQNGGLARPRWAEQGRDSTIGAIEGSTMHGGHALRAELLGQLFHTDFHGFLPSLLRACRCSTTFLMTRVTSASKVSSEATANAPTKSYSL